MEGEGWKGLSVYKGREKMEVGGRKGVVEVGAEGWTV